MPTVLILSSHVAASRVGGGAQAAALTGMGIESILIPTVLFGRHPGLGPPGGGPVPRAILGGVIEGVKASGALERVDAVIAGYFAEADQIRAAAALIDAARAASPAVRIVVDPIMGDDGKGLYVAQAVADALIAELVPRADLITPNAWELTRLSGRQVSDARSALAAARTFNGATLVSSISDGDDIGAMYADPNEACLAVHPRLDADPKGAGDLLTALFVGAILGGASPSGALSASVSEVASLVAARPMSPRMVSL